MPSAKTSTTVRVIVRLPYNRPENPLRDPPPIEWNAEKANILWEVIARSRASDNGGTDWKGLAAHLEVPLPYLLYRARTRYEEDLRGLQDIHGALSPSTTRDTSKAAEDISINGEKPAVVRRTSSQMAGSTARLSSPSRLTTATPLTIRARLNSLGNNSLHPKKATSSSTLTVQNARKTRMPLRPTSPSSSEGSTDTEDEQAAKEEEAERRLEEQDALDKKLRDLQNMMTNDALGLVSTSKGKGKGTDRGRLEVASQRPSHIVHRADELSSRSQSVSSASSPQGSIPSIPLPPPESPQDAPINKRLSTSKSSSPPVISARSARGQSHLRHGGLVSRTASLSEQGSNNGSSASSFSDLSDASLSASALESALLSNIRGGGSRFSAFSRSRFSGRGGGGVRL